MNLGLGANGPRSQRAPFQPEFRFQKGYRHSMFVYLFITFWCCHVACGLLAPWRGKEHAPHAVEGWSLNPQTTREVPKKQNHSDALKDDAKIPWGLEIPSRSPKSIKLPPTLELKHFTLYVRFWKLAVWVSCQWWFYKSAYLSSLS